MSDMTQRTVLVTGANSGIGRVTARELARRGARVLMVCRDPQRGQEARDAIAAETGSERLELLIADLASLAQVRALGAEVTERTGALHVLLHNAGCMSPDRRVTEDGHERTFAVNHLAPFLLTHLLRDLLVASAPARVLTLASQMHASVKAIDFDDLPVAPRYRAMKVYSTSKLANVLFSLELARQLEGTGVTSHSVHPGFVRSNITREGGFMSWLVWLTSPFAISPEEGAEAPLFVATAPSLEGVTGRYFVGTQEREPSALARDEDTARRLWELSEQLTGVADEEVGARMA